jgi:hypothetical protein
MEVRRSPKSKRSMRQPGQRKTGKMRMDQVMDPVVKQMFENAAQANAQNQGQLVTPAPAPAPAPAPVQQTAQEDALTPAERAELEELRALKAANNTTVPPLYAADIYVEPTPVPEIEDDLDEFEPATLGELTEMVRELIQEIKEYHGITFELVMR